MPPTTTKKARINRPDTRPNEKLRRKLSKQVEDAKTVRDIRVTSKKGSEKKEREVAVTALRTKSELEVYMRSLKKKLRHIDELLLAEKSGKTLDAQQQKKIEGMDAVLAELAELTAKSQAS